MLEMMFENLAYFLIGIISLQCLIFSETSLCITHDELVMG